MGIVTAECPTCRAVDPLPDGSCRRCAGRRVVGELLALVPAGTLRARLAAVASLAREALVAQALAQAAGVRREAAKLLGIAEERVSEDVRRWPWLGRAWPMPRGRKPPPKEPSHG